jgi:DNA-binding NarL/FixJ family response regulator
MANVIIIDDHKLILQGLEQTLRNSGEVIVLGVGYCAADCRQLLEHRLPEVLILDVKLPDGDGCELCAELLKKYPTLKVLMLTSYMDKGVFARATQSGAKGYMLKNSDYEEFLEGIRVVAAGGRYVCDKMETVLNQKSDTDIWLTKREHELLNHIAAGLTSSEIAEKMCISEYTVNDHRKSLLRKFSVTNSVQLLRKAIEMKFVLIEN